MVILWAKERFPSIECVLLILWAIIKQLESCVAIIDLEGTVPVYNCLHLPCKRVLIKMTARIGLWTVVVRVSHHVCIHLIHRKATNEIWIVQLVFTLNNIIISCWLRYMHTLACPALLVRCYVLTVTTFLVHSFHLSINLVSKVTNAYLVCVFDA